MEGINLRVLQREIIRQAKKPIQERANVIINNKLEKIKEKTLQEFDDNEITQEIVEKGDLFGFIGFGAEENPTDEVREVLERNIIARDEISLSIRGDKIIISKTIETPSIDSISKECHSEGVSEWTDKPWLKILEDGIPFFSHYLRGSRAKNGEFPNSRSGVGIQAKNVVRSESYGPRRYISQILANLRARISNTKK